MKFAAAIAALVGLAAAAPQSTGTKLHQRTPEERIALGSRMKHGFKKPADNEERGGRVTYSGNWAGVAKHSTGINRVSGVTAVPKVAPSSQSHSGASWVGIDGDSCQQALLQTGIDFYGDGTYDAWYEWIPDNVVFFPDFPLSVGDQISMEVDASSTTEGIATLVNLNTGAKVTHKFTSPPSTLCEHDAVWIVEDFAGNLANFGSILFTNNTATGADGDFTPAGGDIIDIKNDRGKVQTDCGLKGDDVYCNYIS